MPSRSQNKKIDLVNATCVGLLVLILGIVLSAVFCRYVLNQSLTWSDEIVRYLFVWFTLIGAAAVLRDHLHIRVEFFVEYLPKESRWIIEIISLSLVVFFNLLLCVLGILWVFQTKGTFTPALGMPLNLVFYGALPVAAALSVGFGVRQLYLQQYSGSSESCNGDVENELERFNYNTEKNVSVDTE